MTTHGPALMLPAAAIDRLGEALVAADFDYAHVADLLGPLAHAALARNETTPGMLATEGGSPLETLTRLWPLQAAVDAAAAERALPGLVDPLCAAGVLERSVASVRARLDLRPYAEEDRSFYVLSDLTPGLDGAGQGCAADHVLGVSSASSTLAQLTARIPVGTALDLGTGCGVQSLHLAGHAERVVATDVNPRALRMTRFNAALNGIELDVRAGSLYDPVRGEDFDLIVTNPPFVVSPGTGDLLTYRDSGLPGDEMVRRVVLGAADHLRPGGLAHVLANWVHRDCETWQERLGGWLTETGCDAWVVQREVADPAEYVEVWLRDAGHDRTPDYARRYDAWLRWFADQGVTGIGFGWVMLHAAGQGAPSIRLEQWPHPVAQPLGEEVAAWPGRLGAGRAEDSDLLGRRWTLRADVRQETHGEPGAADPEAIVLRQTRGLRRARRVDTVDAAWLGASDGDLTALALLRGVAELLGQDAESVTAERTATLRELIDEGFLVPPGD